MEAKVSHDTVAKVKFIEQNADKETKERLSRGGYLSDEAEVVGIFIKGFPIAKIARFWHIVHRLVKVIISDIIVVANACHYVKK